MKKTNLILLAVLLVSLPTFIIGCAASYETVMSDIAAKHNTPEDTFNALKEVAIDDKEEAVELQAATLYFSLKNPSASFKKESQKLLQVLNESSIDLSDASYMVQSMVYLSALANGSNIYNSNIDADIRGVIDKLCVPSKKLAQKIEDIEEMSDVYYQYHVAQACQAVINDQYAARDASLAIIFNQESCNFSPNVDARMFVLELMECRLKSQGVGITLLLPDKEVLQ